MSRQASRNAKCSETLRHLLSFLAFPMQAMRQTKTRESERSEQIENERETKTCNQFQCQGDQELLNRTVSGITVRDHTFNVRTPRRLVSKGLHLLQTFHSITSDNFGNYVTLNQNVSRAACLGVDTKHNGVLL